MRLQILNRRTLSFFRPGVSIYNPEHYNETILIPLNKINYVSLVKGVVQIGFGTQKIDYIPDYPNDAEAAFKQIQSILADTDAEELK
jgi:hypothetical protein